MNSPKFKQLAIVSIAMHLSILLYVFVLMILSKQGGWNEGFTIVPEQKMIAMVLGGMSLWMTVMTIMCPIIFKAQLGSNKSIPDLILDYSVEDLSKVQTVTIIRLVFAESIAVFGFVIAIVNKTFLLVVPFAIWALVLQFVFGPIYGRMKAKKNDVGY